MTVPHRTPKIVLKWLYPRDIADDMGVSMPTARALIRRIPGAECMYAYERRRGERWHVLKSAYDSWRAGQKVAG